MSSRPNSADASSPPSEDPGKCTLGDYRLREPLLQYVLPQLRLANLNKLRASCRHFQALLDSEHGHNIWLAAVLHSLPRYFHRIIG